MITFYKQFLRGMVYLRNAISWKCITVIDVEHDKQLQVYACQDQRRHAEGTFTDLDIFINS